MRRPSGIAPHHGVRALLKNVAFSLVNPYPCIGYKPAAARTTKTTTRAAGSAFAWPRPALVRAPRPQHLDLPADMVLTCDAYGYPDRVWDPPARYRQAKGHDRNSDISDRVPSPTDRRVFLSGDYKDEQLRTEFGQRTCRLTAGLGAIVLGPIWNIWLGRILRNRATANPV